MNKFDEKAIKNIKFLGLAAVERANSGHPGMLLGIAPVSYLLFKDFLNFNIKKPNWKNRDRFILSAGHASALLYATMFMFGYDISLQDIKDFRQLNSKTAGHPEYWDVPGIECTTGPLGQGLATGVGIAISQKSLNSRFKVNSKHLFNNTTYILISDGDLQEGISYESMSLAGRLQLDNLVVIYDNNKVQLGSDTELCFTENVKKRVEAQGWEYFNITNAYNLTEIKIVLEAARKSKNQKPCFIEVKSHIGFNSKYQDNCKAHGAPFPADVYQDLLKKENWDKYEQFYYDKDIKHKLHEKLYQRSLKKYEKWISLYKEFEQQDPLNAKLILDSTTLSLDYNKILSAVLPTDKKTASVASRVCVGQVLSQVYQSNKLFIGGSADLNSSTQVAGINGYFLPDNLKGQEIAFGVRENAMTAITNGITLSNSMYAYCATFLIFCEYAHPAIRHGALMNLPATYFFSHDSIGLGEDGPTHQPISQITGLRAMINLNVWRPANYAETVASIKYAFESKKTPNVIISSRQNFLQSTNHFSYEEILHGAYIVEESQSNDSQVIILATGSEVGLAYETAAQLFKEYKITTRIISVPCLELFENQSVDYQNTLLAFKQKPIFVIEATNESKWLKYTNPENIFGIYHYGKSGKGAEVFEYFGFTAKNIASKISCIVKGMK